MQQTQLALWDQKLIKFNGFKLNFFEEYSGIYVILRNKYFNILKLNAPLRMVHTFKTTINYFNVHGSVHRKNILIYVQQDATLRSLFYLETALHVSGVTTTHRQERKQLYLLLSAATAADSSIGLTNTRCCRYSCLRSWRRLVVPPETCRAVSR